MVGARPAASSWPTRPTRCASTPPTSWAWTSRATRSRRLWIEVASDIAEEYYASFTLDRGAKQHLGMLSAEGGVEIETVAEENPDAIAKIHVDPVAGLTEAQCREWVAAADLNPDATEGAVEILMGLYRAYTEGDADLVEINPLILTPDGRVHVLDAKVTLDGNAAFRHEWDEYEATQVRDEREAPGPRQGPPVRRARRHGRHHRQRRRSGHEHRRRGQPGGRLTGQLPRHRRRRQRRRHGQRPRGHQQRREGRRRSSSTSSAASPGARRWPTASCRPSSGSS